MEDELIQQRKNKLQALKEKGIDPYGGKFDKPCFINDLVKNFKENEVVSTAGRITALRAHGKSIFGDLRDITGKIQLYVKEDTVGKENFEVLGLLDIGDFLGAKGQTFKTRTGEITINVQELKVLSKGLKPLPEKWHGLKDVETRYRQRYVDLIVNEDSRKVFIARTLLINAIRESLNKKGFIEVETPMMQSVPGGAAAKPFVTHHNALHVDLYLRIAPELYLKRLLVGGFDKVYEINRNFRNEGISVRHNPEFTMLEVYSAYSDCEGMMELTEELLTSLAQGLFGKTEFEFRGNVINMQKPFKRLRLYDAIKEHTGVDFRKEPDIKAKALELGVEIQEGQNEGDILNNIFEKYVEPKLISPTFITDYPAILCPLAKRKKDDPAVTDRFELFVSSIELANAYSELNDPQEQRARFEEQKNFKKIEREVGIDEDFLRALEYGMPPAGGLGIGIDRLVMLFTNQDSIREVILFPQLKPEK